MWELLSDTAPRGVCERRVCSGGVESAAVGWGGAGRRSNEEEIMLEAFQVVTNGAAKATPGDLVELVEQTTGERPQV